MEKTVGTTCTESQEETPVPGWVNMPAGAAKDHAMRCWVIEQADATEHTRFKTWEEDVKQMLYFIEHGKFDNVTPMKPQLHG